MFSVIFCQTRPFLYWPKCLKMDFGAQTLKPKKLVGATCHVFCGWGVSLLVKIPSDWWMQLSFRVSHPCIGTILSTRCWYTYLLQQSTTHKHVKTMIHYKYTIDSIDGWWSWLGLSEKWGTHKIHGVSYFSMLTFIVFTWPDVGGNFRAPFSDAQKDITSSWL